MFPSKLLGLFLILMLPVYSCKAKDFNFTNSKVRVVSNGDKGSASVADYFYTHLVKRNSNKDNLIIERTDDVRGSDGYSTIYFELVEDLNHDYEIVNETNQLSIFAKDKAVFTWITYMLIDKYSEFHAIEVSDLFPNYVDFSSRKGVFAFDYRDPHLLPNTEQEVSALLCTHNVDRDWGIWGHNLKRIFTDDIHTNSLALVNGKRDKDQYCFSANETFQAIKNYIIDYHGTVNRNSMWFMIAPNDNDKVCTCSSCKSLGNSEKNASPAIALLLNRLASAFNNDFFYTIGYRTTQQAPPVSLAKNAGVFLSTINLTKSPFLSKQEHSFQRFEGKLKEWKKVTDEVYLWDYISNFDEYLVPFPVLLRAQEQFKKFRELEVSGLFLNGSGYDYSPFDDVKTYVLSALLIDPDLSVSDLVSKFYKRFYPKTGTLIKGYLLDMEQSMLKDNRNIDIYSSFRRASSSYFNRVSFIEFYESLHRKLPYLEGEEREKVNKLLTALSYVKLQLIYHHPLEEKMLENKGDYFEVSSIIDTIYDDLSRYTYFNLERYKEEAGSLSNYLNEWNQMRRVKIPKNKTTHIEVTGLEESVRVENTDILMDNLPGFVSDFNQGWFLSGQDIRIKCYFETNEKSLLNLQMKFLKNEKHRMLVPSNIELFYEGNLIRNVRGNDLIDHNTYLLWNDRIKVGKEKYLEIRVNKNSGIKRSVIASDEVLLY